MLAAHLGSPDAGDRAALRYADAHPIAAAVAADRLDAWLVRVAMFGWPATALADTYARWARPYGVLRRKLVLTLAVLESSPATHARYDTALAAGAASTWVQLAWEGGTFVLRSVAAAVLLAPLHLAALLLGSPKRDG